MNILLTNIQMTFIFKENMWNQFFLIRQSRVSYQRVCWTEGLGGPCGRGSMSACCIRSRCELKTLVKYFLVESLWICCTDGKTFWCVSLCHVIHCSAVCVVSGGSMSVCSRWRPQASKAAPIWPNLLLPSLLSNDNNSFLKWHTVELLNIELELFCKQLPPLTTSCLKIGKIVKFTERTSV